MKVSEGALQQLKLALRCLSVMRVEPNPVVKTVPTSMGGMKVDSSLISSEAKSLSDAFQQKQS